MANNTNIMSIVRVTKSMKISAIVEMLETGIETKTFAADNRLSVVFSKKDAIDFLNAENAALAKKNSGERKQTQTQKDNQIFKKMIVEFLAAEERNFIPTDTEKTFAGRTCTEILKGIPEFENNEKVVFNNQKIAALANQLVKEDQLTKESIKGRSYFKAAIMIEEEEEDVEEEEEDVEEEEEEA